MPYSFPLVFQFPSFLAQQKRTSRWCYGKSLISTVRSNGTENLIQLIFRHGSFLGYGHLAHFSRPYTESVPSEFRQLQVRTLLYTHIGRNQENPHGSLWASLLVRACSCHLLHRVHLGGIRSFGNVSVDLEVEFFLHVWKTRVF